MLLVIDIGNTSITSGLYNKETLIKKTNFPADIDLQKEQYAGIFSKEFKNDKINSCIISSVVKELTQTIKTAVNQAFDINAYILGADISVNIKIDTKEPQAVGADRIANAYAILKKYPLPAIAVDMGSATTFDIVDKDGVFTGGIIMPGVGMQLKTLAQNTSLLPEYKAEHVHNAIGKDTKTCIMSGVVKGHVHAIEGLVLECEKELKSRPYMVATGGFAELISEQSSSELFDTIDPNLTLEGIRLIFESEKENV